MDNHSLVLTRDITKNWRNANTLTYDNKKLFDGRDKLNVLLGHEVEQQPGNIAREYFCCISWHYDYRRSLG